MMVVLSRLYEEVATARRVVDDLEAAGLPEDDIGILSSSWASSWASARADRMENAGTENTGDVIDRDRDGVDDREEAAGKGAVLGGAAGLLAGLGALMIPGIGPVIAAGWVATLVTTALAGGAAGGALGALIEAGVDENDAAQYADGVRRGGTLVTIRVMGKDRADYERILDAKGLARDRSVRDPAGLTIPPIPGR